MRSEAAIALSVTVLAILATVAALYFAKAIFLPLALALLLTFLLAPAVRLLRNWGVPKSLAVVLVVGFTCVAIGGVSALLAQQVTQLGQKLPEYQFNIEKKINSVRTVGSGGTLARISTFLSNINQEIRKKDQIPAEAQRQTNEEQVKPVPVEVHQPDPTPMQVIHRVLEPLLDPLTTAGLVAIFVIFFLLQRQDLRNRFIRLAGSYDLQRTTEAINDAAYRLSRYFLAQSLLNLLFGIIVGTGLTFIGVPNPVLFGILAALFRFVPYVGAFIAAALPIMLSIAVDPGWSMVLMTAGLFLIVEPVIGQVIEPLVYGHSTGLTPVAIIIAATFWTWLWGPVGLLLSTPLTVCLGVIGRHIPGLRFLDVMIGDEPPLSPAQSFYQRALAGDIDEAVDQAEQLLRRRSLSYVYDQVVIKALILAQVDLQRGLLDTTHVQLVNDAVRDLIAEAADYEDKTPAPTDRKDKNGALPQSEQRDDLPLPPDLPILHDLPPEWRSIPILCAAGRGPFDSTTSMMLAQLLEKHGLECRLEADAAASSSNVVRLTSTGVNMVCFSCLDLGSSPAHLRHSIRRIKRQIPSAALIAAVWGHEDEDSLDQLRTAAGADFYVSSFREAVRLCIDTVSQAQAASAA